MDTFTAHPQRLPTGSQDLQVRAPSHQLPDQGLDLADEVFAVIDHQQHPSLADPVDDGLQQRLLAARPGVGDRGEIDEEHALVKVSEVTVAELDWGPRLAHTTGAREGDHAADPKLFSDLLQQPLATDERRGVARQVRAMPDDTARPGEVVLQIGMMHLEQSYGADVAETMRAQRTKLDTVGQHSHHFADRFAEHDLAPVCCRGDARCMVDRHADEVVVVFHYLSNVQPHAHPQAQTVGPFVRFDGPLRFDRGGEAGGGRIEGEEERVALRAVLDSAGMLDAARTIRR